MQKNVHMNADECLHQSPPTKPPGGFATLKDIFCHSVASSLFRRGAGDTGSSSIAMGGIGRVVRRDRVCILGR